MSETERMRKWWAKPAAADVPRAAPSDGEAAVLDQTARAAAGPADHAQALPDPDPEPDPAGTDADLPSAEADTPPPDIPAPPTVEQTLAQGYGSAMQAAILRSRQAIDRVLQADEASLHDRAFVLDCVLQMGLAYNDWRGLAPFTDAMNAVDYGMLQIPTEFTDYLLLVGASRPATAIEIGVYRGSTAYLAAAYLSRLNPELRYIAVDLADNLVDFDHYAAILPIVKAAPATSGHFAGQAFDLAFIDASHTYDDSRRDWLHVGRSSRMVAFHDINGAEYDGENGGIRRTWAELKLHYRTSRSIVEISHVPQWMGIGVIFNFQAPWMRRLDPSPKDDG